MVTSKRTGSLAGAVLLAAALSLAGCGVATSGAGTRGTQVPVAQAARLGDQLPAGASIDRTSQTITFTSQEVGLVVLASPAMPAENFRIAGMTDPSIVVPAGARVSLRLINADDDMAHGLVIARYGAASSVMPMMSGGPVFPGAAVWSIGERTSTGMYTGTLTFIASVPGRYQYLCPVPGHARDGMAGTFTVS